MTIKPVVPRKLANRDVDAAIAHYVNEGADDAALGFIDGLEKAYGHIARRPSIGSLRYAYELDLPELRALPLTRYPYLVFYVERDDGIDVWRVLHMHRDVPESLGEP